MPKLNDERVFDQTPGGLYIVAETQVDCTNVLERIGAFYNWHLEPPSCLRPIARHLNPIYNGTRIHPNDDVWWILFYKGYRVLIIKHDTLICGPHAVRLYFRSQQTGLLYWLATLQITDVMFYDEESITTALINAIVSKQFYVAPASRKDIVAL